MKRYNNIIKIALFALVICVMTVPVYASSKDDAAKQLWQMGKSAYGADEYDAAIKAFEQIAEMGYKSDVLYYNLGNAYYKRGVNNVNSSGEAFNSGELGRAILNYERALKMNPELEDARYNLDLAYTHTDAPEAFPAGFIPTLWRSMSGALSSNTWTIISIVMFGVTLLLVLLYLLANNIKLRKASFFISIVTLVIFIFTTAFAVTQRTTQRTDKRAIIICNDTQDIFAEPSNKSKRLRTYMQGVAVEVLRRDKEWSEVRFADGEKGWILTEAIEII